MSKYYDFNRAQGKPIVNLICATGFPPQTYKRVLTPLFDKYHVISIQLRPFWSDQSVHNAPELLKHWSQFADDLLIELDQLTNEPIINIGHSIGGVVSIYAAIKCPERFSRLVLIEPTMLSPFHLAGLSVAKATGRLPRVADSALRRRVFWNSKQEMLAYFQNKPLFKRWPQDVLQAYVEGMGVTEQDGTVRLAWSPQWEARIFRTMPSDIWQYPRRIKHDFILIRGALSTEFGAAISARLFKLLRIGQPTRIVVVPDAGHLVPQEKPDEVGRLIADFLR
jgi:pimeloyl-ACP methyl ester carboxylesterase